VEFLSSELTIGRTINTSQETRQDTGTNIDYKELSGVKPKTDPYKRSSKKEVERDPKDHTEAERLKTFLPSAAD
jgi:hypothetical protein